MNREEATGALINVGSAAMYFLGVMLAQGRLSEANTAAAHSLVRMWVDAAIQRDDAVRAEPRALTKRELFATHMAGGALVAMCPSAYRDVRVIAGQVVAAADAVLAELERTAKP